MHMRPPHVATTKGESVRMPTAAQTAAAQQHASSTPVPTAVTEAAQKDSAVRSQTTTTTAPKAKAKGVVIQEPTAEGQKKKDNSEVKGKGKEVLVESEKPMKSKHQVQADEELARKLQEEEAESIAKLKKEKSQLQKDEELAKKLHA